MESLLSAKRSSSSSIGKSNANQLNGSGTSYTTIVGGGTVKDGKDSSSRGSKISMRRVNAVNPEGLSSSGKNLSGDAFSLPLNDLHNYDAGKDGECRGVDGDSVDDHADNTSSLYDPRYFTMTMPNLPPHRYTMANIGSRMPHMTYNVADIETIVTTHRQPQTCGDKFAVNLVSFVGFIMNGITRFDTSVVGSMSKDKWVSRAVFLESVAAVPGMIAAMVRHLDSLRRMKRDHGWVRHLLEEADNERMHLFFFLREKNPGIFFRICVWFTQLGFLVMNIVFYLVSPRTMHRFVGYLEEEAVKTYNSMVREIDDPDGALREWKTKPAPKDMAAYYCLGNEIHKKGSADYERYLDKIPAGLCPPSPSPSPLPSMRSIKVTGGALVESSSSPYYGPTYRDIILCIRADETSHREHNHMFADLHGSATERMIPREELEIVKFSSQHVTSSSAFLCGDRAQQQHQSHPESSYQQAGTRRKDFIGQCDESKSITHPVGVTCVLSPILSSPPVKSHVEAADMTAERSLRDTATVSANSVVTQEHLVPLISAPSVVVGGNNNVSPLMPSTPSTLSPAVPSDARISQQQYFSPVDPQFSADSQCVQSQQHTYQKHKPIPIHGPETAKHHAKAQQHMFTTSASITDPYYIEV